MVSETAQMEKDEAIENAERDQGKGKERGPPRFLMKIYEMVDDQETNSVISWNSSGTGFIIWDHNKFSIDILPSHFRTCVLSSFVYQLNSYGFRKISSERYEYANQCFQAGKKHWLKNITRRNQKPEASKECASSSPDHVSTNDVMKTKLDAVITEQNKMKLQSQEIKHNLEDMEHQLAGLETDMRFQELKDEKMKMNAVLLEQFIMQYLGKKNDGASGGKSKRTRSDDPMEKSLSSADGSVSSIQDRKVKKAKENVENYQFWKNMLEEDAGCSLSREQGDLAARHSKAIAELNDMMETNIAIQREIMVTKPADTEVEDDGHLELWA